MLWFEQLSAGPALRVSDSFETAQGCMRVPRLVCFAFGMFASWLIKLAIRGQS